MQSKTSFFSLVLFKKNISRTWIVGLLEFILLTIIMPIDFIISMAHFDDYWYAESGYTKTAMWYESISYKPIVPFTFVVAILLAGITLWYLFFKRDNYMMHAFPVSRKSLYFTSFISCSIVGLLPLILNAIVLTVIAVAEQVHAFDAIWYYTLVGVVSTELFLSIAFFSLMTSGQIVTAIVFYFIFNFLYTLIEIAFRLTASLLLFGMSESLSGLTYNMASPILFMGSNCKVSTYTTYDDLGQIKTFTHNLDGAGYLLIYAVVAIVFIAIAYLLYKAKKLETVHDFISVSFLKPVFSVGISFFVSMVAGAFVAGLVDSAHYLRYSTRFAIAIISTLVIGCIIFYATQMMIEKTIRVFSAKKFGFMICYTLAAFVAMLLMRTDVFKLENKVPDAEDIAWVGIQSNYTMVFTDEEEIYSVRELHKNFLADKKELRDVNVIYQDVPGSTISFKYKLKNGKVVLRTYSVVDTNSEEVSDTYLSATEPILDYLNYPARIKEHIIGNIWNNCDITDMTFSTYTYDEKIQDFHSSMESFDYLTEKEKLAKNKKVYEAVLKDIDEGKLFITDFGMESFYDEDDVLYNDFSFVVYNSEVPYFSDEETYWDYGWAENGATYERSIYTMLTRDCTNILHALKAEGFYEDDNQIITISEYNDIMGYNDDPIIY